MALTTRIVFALTIAMVGLCVYLVARRWHPRRLFLMNLGRELTAVDLARGRRVQVVNALVVALGVAGVFAVDDADVALVLSLVCPLLGVLWLVVETLAAVKSAEPLAPVPQDFVSIDPVATGSPQTGRLPSIWEYVSPQLQSLNVFAIAVGIATVAWIIDKLPERVPVHWDAAGVVDRWGNPLEHWALLPVLLFDTVLMWGIIAFVAAERWVLPAENQERFIALQRRRRTLLVRMIEWIMVGINAGMVVMWVLLAAGGLTGLGKLSGIGLVAGLIVVFAAAIVPLPVYFPKLLRVADEIQAVAGTEVLGTHSDGWRWGGLVYYAPGDPAVWVPKRLGIGQTLNFARPWAWVFMAAVLGVPLLITVLLLAFL